MWILRLWLIKKFVKHYTGVIYKSSVHNSQGELLLRRAAITRIGPLVGFLLALMALTLGYFEDPSMTSEDSLLLLQTMSGCLVILGLMTLALSVSRTVVDQDGVSSSRLFMNRRLSFDEMNQVTFTRLFGGCMELSGQGKKIRVPLDTSGFAVFFERLKQRNSQLELGEIELELEKRSKLLESLGYRVQS
ncbi:hypothetical protein [Cohnella mopanensis]|uniref:hypothetical protein n=1 Tax=Cohnella mopanensis TaxID=2911966 RepID=UPI001EF9837E|nr:hypothetical protein [Cohnella mopanensis]